MKKEGNTAELLASDDALDNAELPVGGRHEGALILKATPRSRKGRAYFSGSEGNTVYLLPSDQSLGRR